MFWLFRTFVCRRKGHREARTLLTIDSMSHPEYAIMGWHYNCIRCGNVRKTYTRTPFARLAKGQTQKPEE